MNPLSMMGGGGLSATGGASGPSRSDGSSTASGNFGAFNVGGDPMSSMVGMIVPAMLAMVVVWLVMKKR